MKNLEENHQYFFLIVIKLISKRYEIPEKGWRNLAENQPSLLVLKSSHFFLEKNLQIRSSSKLQTHCLSSNFVIQCQQDLVKRCRVVVATNDCVYDPREISQNYKKKNYLKIFRERKIDCKTLKHQKRFLSCETRNC